MKQSILLILISIFIFCTTTDSNADNKLVKDLNYEINQYYAAGGIGDFFRAIGNFIGDLSRPVWGAYEVNGQNNNAPLALFNRLTFQSDRLAIIANIKIDNSDFKKIYEKIFENATNNSTYTIPSNTWPSGALGAMHPRAANGIYVFAQNNYSLIISASMISAAIEFNDFGVRWFNVEFRPNRWAESGYSYVHKTLWKGSGKLLNEDTLIWQNGLKG
jgi:hypothetical protein